MAQRSKAPTWSQVAVKNAGFRDALRAFEFATGWGLAVAFLGREPESIDEYAEVAEVSRATAFRQQQAFRKAFPMLDGPSDLTAATGQQSSLDEFVRSCRTMAEAKEKSAAEVFAMGAAVVKAGARSISPAVRLKRVGGGRPAAEP